jgi:hypothetical protein
MTQPPQPTSEQELEAEVKKKLHKLLFAYQRTTLPDVGAVGIHNRNNTEQIFEFVEMLLSTHRQQVIDEVERWMAIENDISIVHKDQWDKFIEALKGK